MRMYRVLERPTAQETVSNTLKKMTLNQDLNHSTMWSWLVYQMGDFGAISKIMNIAKPPNLAVLLCPHI